MTPSVYGHRNLQRFPAPPPPVTSAHQPHLHQSKFRFLQWTKVEKTRNNSPLDRLIQPRRQMHDIRHRPHHAPVMQQRVSRASFRADLETLLSALRFTTEPTSSITHSANKCYPAKLSAPTGRPNICINRDPTEL